MHLLHEPTMNENGRGDPPTEIWGLLNSKMLLEQRREWPLTNMSWPITIIYLLARWDIRASHMGITHCYRSTLSTTDGYWGERVQSL